MLYKNFLNIYHIFHTLRFSAYSNICKIFSMYTFKISYKYYVRYARNVSHYERKGMISS